MSSAVSKNKNKKHRIYGIPCAMLEHLVVGQKFTSVLVESAASIFKVKQIIFEDDTS